jgi:hypothetical protein
MNGLPFQQSAINRFTRHPSQSALKYSSGNIIEIQGVRDIKFSCIR